MSGLVYTNAFVASGRIMGRIYRRSIGACESAPLSFFSYFLSFSAFPHPSSSPSLFRVVSGDADDARIGSFIGDSAFCGKITASGASTLTHSSTASATT